MKVLLDEQIIITKEMSKTNIAVDVLVDDDYSKLIFDCEYTPKEIHDDAICKEIIEEGMERYLPKEQFSSYKNFMPLSNLITISIDDENGNYLGCAHRGASKLTHVISENYSDKGFIPKKIQKGTYKVVLNVHLVAYGEVAYKLKVVGE